MAVNKNGAAAALRLPGVRTKGDVVAGRYRVESILGRGTSGFVVAARHVQLRHAVRLKILTSATRAQQKAQRKYLAHAHRAATLQGRHVARIVDTGVTDDGDAFIASEPLDGESVADALKTRTRVSVHEAVRWAMEACEAVGEAHAQGFPHGDLKPENLFLVRGNGRERTVKIVDFGMSPLADEGSSAFFTSPAYLAPEQIQDPERVDARADVWALGVILHQAIAGALPFSGSTVSAMLVAVAFDEPAPLSDVSPGLAALVRRCLAKDPAERPANATELARALTRVAETEGTHVVSAATASSEPPLAMSVDQTPSALKTAPYPLMMHSEVVPAAPRSTARASSVVAIPQPPRVPSLEDIPALSISRSPAVADRRRRGALLTACAAGVLALLGFALPANDDPRAARDTERPPILPPGEGTSIAHGPVEPPVFVPPSFRLPEAPSSTRSDDQLGKLDAPVAVPVQPMLPSTPAPPSPIDAAFGPAAADILHFAAPATAWKRSAAPARDDASTRGFTRPSRPADGRK